MGKKKYDCLLIAPKSVYRNNIMIFDSIVNTGFIRKDSVMLFYSELSENQLMDFMNNLSANVNEQSYKIITLINHVGSEIRQYGEFDSGFSIKFVTDNANSDTVSWAIPSELYVLKEK